MALLAALPLSTCLAAVFLAGILLGSLVNWAIYRLAWNPREISPWGPTPTDAPPRCWRDRIPVLGWLGLRRERKIHGDIFWVRPLMIELMLGLGLAALYWWENVELGLILPQINAFPFPFQIANAPGIVPAWVTHQGFIAHAVLIVLMTSASFIDIDEKIIPDEITVPGTLLGLALATILPLSLLPHIALRSLPPAVGVPVTIPEVVLPQDALFFAEPVTLTCPNLWPSQLEGAPNWKSLVIGQACWWFWCFAIAPRIWRGRHGPARALQLIARRVGRELTRVPLGFIAWSGSLAIAAIWWWGEAAWVSLLTSLIGLAVSGGLIWIVRIVGTVALGREAMGFGDVTLMMMVGTFLGWQAGVLIFFISPFAGLIVGLVQAVTRRDDVIPYGPFLCLGSLLVMIMWPTVWNMGMQDLFHVGWLVPVVLAVCFVSLFGLLGIWQQIKTRIF